MFHSHDSAQRKIQEMGKNRPRVGYEDETDPDVRSVAEASGYSKGTKTGLQKDLGTGKELRAPECLRASVHPDLVDSTSQHVKDIPPARPVTGSCTSSLPPGFTVVAVRQRPSFTPHRKLDLSWRSFQLNHAERMAVPRSRTCA